MRQKALLAATIAALAAGGAGEAIAGDVHAKVTIKSKRTAGKDKIFGKVITRDHACEAKRKVRLVVKRPNRSKNKVATVRTDGRGRWTYVPESGNAPGGYTNEGTRYADPGDYIAKVAEVDVNSGGGRVVCAANKSSNHYVG